MRSCPPPFGIGGRRNVEQWPVDFAQTGRPAEQLVHDFSDSGLGGLDIAGGQRVVVELHAQGGAVALLGDDRTAAVETGPAIRQHY